MAPQPPPWPEETPKAYVIEDGAVCFPPPSDEALLGRLIFLDTAYPRLCQQSIDLYADHVRRELVRDMSALERAHAVEITEEIAEKESRPAIWLVAILTVVALSGGLVGGFFIGQASGK